MDPLYDPRPPVWIPITVRSDFEAAEMSRNAFCKPLTATVVPRPIAWMSTTSADGTHY
ncbi:hypothetical protein [Streptomyces chattanoogensis]|uniref:hypothetical protein n=1 Tax=Streptomyces chattanoogensis TaxID=66876 RepID=UPI000A89CCFB|nr:hypothetical protein [Streptomyces chattanoogensis]